VFQYKYRLHTLTLFTMLLLGLQSKLSRSYYCNSQCK